MSEQTAKHRGNWNIPICMKSDKCINYSAKCDTCFQYSQFELNRAIDKKETVCDKKF